jgi:muramoyltetrapeptide carboxypeptidase LdcA involved in peptidoglycan recycling
MNHMTLHIGLLGLSDPAPYPQSLKEALEGIGAKVVVSPFVSQPSSGRMRAALFNEWVREGVDILFDVSGGNLANQTIPYLDLDAWKQSKTLFAGYSDLTPVLNVLSVYKPCLLYSAVRNVEETIDWLLGGQALFDWHAYALQPGTISGIIMGGNLRCLLKLAGTPAFPDLTDKILFLEANSGTPAFLASCFAQLEQMGVPAKIAGVLLGQFTQLDQSHDDSWFDFLSAWSVPVFRTRDIGHAPGSKALPLGRNLTL